MIEFLFHLHPSTNKNRMVLVSKMIEAYTTGSIAFDHYENIHQSDEKGNWFDGPMTNYYKVVGHTFTTKETVKHGKGGDKLHIDTKHIFQMISTDKHGTPLYEKYNRGIADEFHCTFYRWGKIEK